MIYNILTSSYSAREKFIIIIAFACAAMFAIVVHEVAHGYVALKNGDLTPKLSGRITFNPKAHFDLFGLLMFFIVGFGWAKPVPINPDNFEKKKLGMITTSLAGIVSNLFIALVNIGLICLVYIIPESVVYRSTFLEVLWQLFFYYLYYSIIVNCSLMLFNLLPVYPLDGFRVVETLFSHTNPYVKLNYKYGNWTLIILFVVISLIPDRFNMFSLFIGEIQQLVYLILGSL